MATEKLTRSKNGGHQTIYRFNNGYGASVVCHSFSYGTEMAVVKFYGPNIDDFDLCYSTGITHDVLGHLSPADVDQYLARIEKLPPVRRHLSPTDVEQYLARIEKLPPVRN